MSNEMIAFLDIGSFCSVLDGGVELTCNKPGPEGVFEYYNSEEEVAFCIARADLKEIVPDLPKKQMKVRLHLEFSY